MDFSAWALGDPVGDTVGSVTDLYSDLTKVRALSRGDKKGFLFLFGAKFQDVPRLTIQCLAEGRECGKTDGPSLVRLQDGEVRKSDPHLFRQLGQGLSPVEEDPVEVHVDSHGFLLTP
jgi:hypothetical protein